MADTRPPLDSFVKRQPLDSFYKGSGSDVISQAVALPPTPGIGPYADIGGPLQNVAFGIRPEFAKQTGYGAFEGATLGIPRIALSQAGINIPRGNTLGQVGGFMAGIGPKLAAAAGEAILPAAAKPISMGIKGAIEGGIGGALFPQEKITDFGKRSGAAAGGAFFGSAIGTGIGLFKLAQDAARTRDFIKAATNELDNMKIGKQANLPDDIQQGIKNLRIRKDALIKQEKSIFDKQTKNLSSLIKKESESQAQRIKQPILDYFKSFKQEWGKSFDDALESAPQQGLDYNDLKGIGDGTIKELTDMGIDPKGNVVRTIRTQIKKFNPKEINVTRTVMEPNELGVPLPRQIVETQPGSKFIKNRELVNIKRAVSQSLSAPAKIGQFTEEDIAGAIFNKKLSERIGQNVGDRLGELADSYKKFTDLAKFTYKHFKPRASEYEIGAGSNILRKFATGSATEGEVKAIKDLESATGIKFANNLDEMKQSLDKLRQLKPAILEQIEGRFSRAIREMENAKLRISRGNKMAKFNIQREIEAKKELLNDLTSFKRNAIEIVKSLGIPTSIGAAIYATRRR